MALAPWLLLVDLTACDSSAAVTAAAGVPGYNLMSSSRTVAKGGNALGPDGKPDGASCLASAWADDYFATIKHFIEETGFDMIET